MNYSHSALELRSKTGCTLSQCNEVIQFYEGRMSLAYKFLDEWNSGVLHKKPDGTKYTKTEYMQYIKDKWNKRLENVDFIKTTYTDCGELEIDSIRPSSFEEMDSWFDEDTGGDGLVQEMFDINGITEGDSFGDGEWEVMKTFGHHESCSYWFYIRNINTGEYQVVNLS